MDTNSSAASPNSSPPSLLYSSIFPPKFTLSSSLSLTPSTLSDDDGGHRHNDGNTMHRLGQAQLVLECEELRDHLRELNNEVDSLCRENAVLRSANTDLVKLLSSPAALPNFLNASSYLNPFMAEELKPLGGGVVSPRDGDEASDISPTSVIIDRNRFNADRFSLPTSISVRSNGYKKANPPSFGANHPLPPARIPEEGTSGTMAVKAYNQGMLKTQLCNKWQESGAHARARVPLRRKLSVWSRRRRAEAGDEAPAQQDSGLQDGPHPRQLPLQSPLPFPPFSQRPR